MKRFTDLYLELDQTTKTTEKIDALKRYFSEAPARDAAWALYFLSGRKPRQAVSSTRLRLWVMELTGTPDWLFEESYQAVGDLAETISLLLPSHQGGHSRFLHEVIEETVLPLRSMDEADQRAVVERMWNELNYTERFLWNKLVTGGFRVGVSQQLVVKGLASLTGLPVDALSHRLMGTWEPEAAFYEKLIDPNVDHAEDQLGRPYPFYLAHPIEGEPESLGSIEEWQAEWKWDGIRAQLIRRQGEIFLWSRGEELITERFPEIASAGPLIPDGSVIDGEVLPWREGRVLPFGELQRRIGRKNLTSKILSETPAVLQCYDLLEFEGRDLRSDPLSERRRLLERIVEGMPEPATLKLSPIVTASDWQGLAAMREESAALRVEGLMLKRLSSPYRVGRQRGDWWKWKIEPFTVDAVLIYAQRGHGKRASLYTDYTFGVWNDGQLTPFAKAYSGLTDAEIDEVDRFIRAHTRESFGPVRSVTPELVFEIAFEGIQRSTRHKSGVAVRFPRILRWRKDKKIEDADALETIHRLLEQRG